MADNSITVAGNLTDDPQLHFTNSGHAVANFTVAVSRRQKNGDAWEDVNEGFFRCTVWRNLAENAAETLHKGDRVICHGRLTMETWTGADGGNRTTPLIQVDDVGPSLKWAKAEVSKVRKDKAEQPAMAATGEGWS